MPKQNAFLAKAVAAEIDRLIEQGKLFTYEDVEENVRNNLVFWSKLITVGVNRALGIGKTRFTRDVQPVLDKLQMEFFEDKKKAGETYAKSVIERMYNEIMDE